MKVLHLSHIDLDGYGSQYVAKHFFNDIAFYNANYGKEIMVRLGEMFCALTKEKTLFLITDLNLTLQEASYVQERVCELKIEGYDIELKLLDHHISGAQSAEKFYWYFLDCTRSACKITFDTLIANYPLLDAQKEAWLRDFSTMVNSVDIWLSEGKYFEFGKVLMGAISGAKDPNRLMFEDKNREFKFELLERSKDFLYLPKGEVELDNALFLLKKEIFRGDPKKETMDNIFANYLVELLKEKKKECEITYKGKRGFLSYMLGCVSVVGNQFLCQNPEFDFFLDVNARGNISLRANGNCDVSEMAMQCFGGGGHKNASGGKIEGFKESFFYADIKQQIENILQEKE
ncbi:DHH family phosphoesterase [Helicobacter cholecystus]|uniref:DHH family phosphoesterase n=1 Tax=Helicobacter cholecystus TaxID=45498 RepID=UPI002739CE2C|nr:3',5'-cyclic-nucleotide phosphodiesterase [Helicobacter cholecystus]